jgi:hypothetical protein
LKHGQSQRLTAIVLGYASWAELLKHIGTASPSPLDEDVDAATWEARRDAQATRLQRDRSLSREIAEAIIDMWRPSMGPAAYNSEFADDDEIEGDFDLDDLRLARPADVNFGIDICNGLKWPILSAGYEPEFGMASVHTYGRNPNKPVPIFVSPLAYVPGDDEDVQAAEQRRMVASFMRPFAGAPGACIIYQFPMTSGEFVFIGAVLRNGKWLDMPWSSALTSIDTLFEWADKGWNLHERRPETADHDGKLDSLVRQCMEKSYKRTMGEL